VSTLAVSLGVVLLLVSIGLTNGVMNDSAERTRKVGGDFIVQPPNGSLLFALDSGTVDIRLSRVIEAVEGVEAVTPILTKFIHDNFHLIFGIDPRSFKKVNSSLRILDGRFFEAPDEVMVDTLYARTRELKVGDELTFLGRTFKISGIFEQGTASRVLIPLATLQQMNGTEGKATMFFVRAAEGVDRELLYHRLKERMEGYKITKTEQLQELMASNTPVYKEFITAIVFVSVAISFLIILLAMYSTITERTREIGILKSLGASKRYIVDLVLRESVVICAIGVGLGFLLTFITIHLILFAFPSMQVVIPGFWRVTAVIMAIGGGALGAIYPAFKAAQLDPVKALGYE
jgi:putative ABC transport system permease protein